MHDDFWKLSGRQKWYEPEPARAVFLASFFIELGTTRYGPAWPGTIGMPPAATATALIKEIAQAAASGAINTLVLNPKTFEFQPIPRRGWRNPKALSARFSRCRIDASDPVSGAAEGAHHGDIYVQRDDAASYLETIKSARTTQSDVVTLDHLSTYVRFLIFIAQQEKIDECNPPPLIELKRIIARSWRPWRLASSGVSVLPAEAVLTDTKVSEMATLLRGEKARAAKGGGGGKK